MKNSRWRTKATIVKKRGYRTCIYLDSSELSDENDAMNIHLHFQFTILVYYGLKTIKNDKILPKWEGSAIFFQKFLCSLHFQ